MTDKKLIDRYQGTRGMHGYERVKGLVDSYKSEVLTPFVHAIFEQQTENKRVLDLASGAGFGGDYIEGLGFTVLKLDISRTGLSYSEGLRTQAFVEHLPVPDGSFVGIHMKDALVHVFDKDKLVAEINRVLEPGGVALLVSQFNKINFISVGKKEVEVPFDDNEDLGKVHSIIKIQFGSKSISPPYFKTIPIDVIKKSLDANLKLVNLWEWEPGNREREWHKEQTKRFAILLQKRVI